MNKEIIDLKAIIENNTEEEINPKEWPDYTEREVIELMRIAIHQALVLASEKAKCIDEGDLGGDGEWHPYFIVDKQSILDVEKLMK